MPKTDAGAGQVWSRLRSGLIQWSEKVVRQNGTAFLVVATVTVLAALLLTRGFLAQSSVVAVDMQVSAGEQAVLFVNHNFDRAYKLPLIPETRTVYRFESLPGNLHQLYLDPTNAKAAELRIFGISFEQRGREVLRITPEQMSRWVNPEVLREVREQTLVIEPSRENVAFYSAQPFTKFSGLYSVLNGFYRSVLPGTGLILLGLAVFYLAGRREDWLTHLVPLMLLMGLGLLAGPLAAWVLAGGGPLNSVQTAVGNAGYLGFSKAAESRAFYATLGWAVLLAGLAAVVLRRTGPQTGQSGDAQPGKHETTFSPWFITICIAAFAVLGFPAIREAWTALSETVHQPHWDETNLLTWKYMVTQGWLPFRDFYYPYFGFYSMVRPFPWDLMRLHFHNLMVFSGFFLAVYFLANKRISWTLIMLLSVFLGISGGHLTFVYRYFLALNLVLLYLALSESSPTGWRAYVLYGAYVGWVFSRVPVQCVYAAIPVFILEVIRFLEIGPRGYLARLPKWLIALAAAVALIIANLVILAARGQLPGLLEFLLHAGSLADLAAMPAGLQGWYAWAFRNDQLVLYGTLGSLLLGVYFRLCPPAGVNHRLGRMLLGLGLLGLLVMQKQLIRPHIAEQFLGYFLVALVLFFAISSQRWTVRQQQLALLALMAGLSALLAAGTAWSGLATYGSRLARLPANLTPLFVGQQERNARQAAFFRPDSYRRYHGATAFSSLLQTWPQADADFKFYVLGDDSYFYSLAGQKPPFFIALYNLSDIREQRYLLDWLNREAIRYVIWNPRETGMDGVPHVVRVPLIYNYMVRHFGPYEKFGDYHVLRRNAPGQAPDLGFWREQLGTAVDLGAVPLSAAREPLPAAVGDGTATPSQWLVGETRGGGQDAKQTLLLSVGGQEYQVRFDQRKDEDRYVIALDRLWFWGVIKGADISLTIPEQQASGITWKQVETSAPGNRLY